MEDIILSAYHGGLGDNLQFSTLPELFSKKGHNVYIWNKSYFRNQEIYDFVWGSNPYIKGKKDGKWNVGDTPGIKYKKITNSFIKNWEILHGFNGVNDYPKIYYVPKLIDGFKSCILIDTTSISHYYNVDMINIIILSLRKKYPGKKFLRIRFKTNLNPKNQKAPALNGIVNDYFINACDDDIFIKSLFHYYDLMYSSYGLICLHTGASHLGTCIKNIRSDFENICLITTFTEKRDLFLFPNVKYVKVQD